jgi:rSAM/selenodomain-associated transferase 1
MSHRPDLVLFVRYPVAGQCKTRLIPALGPEGAAALHRRLSERTVSVLRAAGGPVVIAYTGAGEAAFCDWLGADLEYVPQAEGDLTARLLPFAARAPVIFFGADTPDLTPAHVTAAVDALSDYSIAIGPAEDGGYYLIAMREPRPDLITDMPWSTSEVLPETLRRLAATGTVPALLETLSDCDRPEDLARWPGLAA